MRDIASTLAFWFRVWLATAIVILAELAHALRWAGAMKVLIVAARRVAPQRPPFRWKDYRV
jgi:hypothetical protein